MDTEPLTVVQESTHDASTHEVDDSLEPLVFGHEKISIVIEIDKTRLVEEEETTNPIT